MRKPREDRAALWRSRVPAVGGNGVFEGVIWVVFFSGSRPPNKRARARCAELQQIAAALVEEYPRSSICQGSPGVHVRYAPDMPTGGCAKHKIFFESSYNQINPSMAQSWFFSSLVGKLDGWLIRQQPNKSLPNGGWTWPIPDPLLEEMDAAVRKLRR